MSTMCIHGPKNLPKNMLELLPSAMCFMSSKLYMYKCI